MQKSKLNSKNFEEFDPYGSIPEMTRPRDSLTRPKTRYEQLYCWFYYIEMILDPKMTRHVLDRLDSTPEFLSEWGKTWYDGEEFAEKAGFYGQKPKTL